jgi:hypothetical protein
MYEISIFLHVSCLEIMGMILKFMKIQGTSYNGLANFVVVDMRVVFWYVSGSGHARRVLVC